MKGEIAALEREVTQAKPETGDDTAAGLAVPASPYVLRLREALRSADAEMKILKSEEQRLRSHHRDLPGPRGEHAAAGAGVPGHLA